MRSRFEKGLVVRLKPALIISNPERPEAYNPCNNCRGLLSKSN